MRLGLKYVAGLRPETGRRIEAARAARPFASLADFEDRVRPEQAELRKLASSGALAALGGTRRQVLWQIEALGRSGRLFAGGERGQSGRQEGEGGGGGHPLPEMSRHEEMLEDFASTGLTTGAHPLSFVRERLDREGVVRAAALAGAAHGSRVRVAGVTIVRQRPGTAKGFVFITLEDETGFANAIVTPRLFEAQRRAILNLGSMIIEGIVQSRDGVVLIKADRFLPLPGRPATINISHDFH